MEQLYKKAKEFLLEYHWTDDTLRKAENPMVLVATMIEVFVNNNNLQSVTAKTEQERFEDEIILTNDGSIVGRTMKKLDYDVQFKKQEPQFDNNCKADDDFVKAYEQEHQTADDEEQFDYNKWINDSQTQDELYKAVKWCSERAFDIGDVPLLLVEFASQEHPQLIVAKSGRKYRSIPEGMDIETWDTMTPAERLNYRGLIEHPQITGEIYDILDCIAKFDINAETYEKADYFEVIQKDVQKWLQNEVSQEHPITGYPKEFVEWIGEHYNYGHHGTWIARYTDQRIRDNWKATDELFIYWKENINRCKVAP